MANISLPRLFTELDTETRGDFERPILGKVGYQ